MRYFHIRGQRLWIDRKTVILRGDRNFAAPQIFHRLVPAAMPEFQFEGRSPEREAENLMAKTNSENRFLAHQIVHSLRARTAARLDRRGRWKERFRRDRWPALPLRLSMPGQR